jgi:hypothetical protein
MDIDVSQVFSMLTREMLIKEIRELEQLENEDDKVDLTKDKKKPTGKAEKKKGCC